MYPSGPGNVSSPSVGVEIDFVGTSSKAAENSFPMLTTLPTLCATRERPGRPLYFSRGSCFRFVPGNAETRAKVNAEAVPSAAGKVTVPLSRVPGSPGSPGSANRIKADPPRAAPIPPSTASFPPPFLRPCALSPDFPPRALFHTVVRNNKIQADCKVIHRKWGL